MAKIRKGDRREEIESAGADRGHSAGAERGDGSRQNRKNGEGEKIHSGSKENGLCQG